MKFASAISRLVRNPVPSEGPSDAVPDRAKEGAKEEAKEEDRRSNEGAPRGEAGPPYVRSRRTTVTSPISAHLAQSMMSEAKEPDAPEAALEGVITSRVGEDEATAKSTVPGLRLLSSVSLAGVFQRDGMTLASDLSLPEELFARPAQPRKSAEPRRSPASETGTRSSGANASDNAGADSGPRRSSPGVRKAREESFPRGTIIDKYRIERLVGRGGVAAVYRATHLLLGTPVAIKMLRPSVLASHPHLARLLYDEARFAARLDHPNVVRVHDVTHSASITYIVMEFIDGRSLAETIRNEGSLPWPRVVEIGAAVAAGLKEALGARLIHRDIKPANILLGRRGEIKIVDLGLVLRTGSLLDERGGDDVRPRPGIGTCGYMAPEQAIDAERVDFRADIYALGATLYEAAVGQPPFPLKDMARCFEQHARDMPAPPETRRRGLPATFSATLMRMLAKSPDDRFASYDDLAEAFGKLAIEAAKSPSTSISGR